MDTLTADQIKSLWKNDGARKADFSRGDVWNVPIRRSWTDAFHRSKNSDPTKMTPPKEMYVAFRLERGVYGVAGEMGHCITRVVGRGVVVEEIHHHDKPVYIPFDAAQSESR